MRFSINHTHAAQVMFSSISGFLHAVVGGAYEGLLHFCEIEQLQLGRDRSVVLTKLRHGRRGSVAVVVGESGVRDRLRHCTTSWAAHWPLCAVDLCDITYAERHWQTAVKAVAAVTGCSMASSTMAVPFLQGQSCPVVMRGLYCAYQPDRAKTHDYGAGETTQANIPKQRSHRSAARPIASRFGNVPRPKANIVSAPSIGCALATAMVSTL